MTLWLVEWSPDDDINFRIIVVNFEIYVYNFLKQQQIETQNTKSDMLSWIVYNFRSKFEFSPNVNESFVFTQRIVDEMNIKLLFW